jgi:hypothetical protein
VTAVATLLWGQVKPILLYLVLGLAFVGTVAMVLLRVKNAGVMQERAETAIKAIDNLKRQEQARAAAPHSVEETIDALNKGGF